MYELLSKHLKLNEEIVLEAPDRGSLAYGELNDTLINLKNTFKDFSISKSDPVAMVLPNGPDLGVLFLASACLELLLH